MRIIIVITKYQVTITKNCGVLASLHERKSVVSYRTRQQFLFQCIVSTL
jgi:hypothetical protein